MTTLPRLLRMEEIEKYHGIWIIKKLQTGVILDKLL